MKLKILLSLLFLLSGFCSLLYQVVWLRLAMAEFGVLSSVISVVLSVFMLGLGLGSWLGGRLSKMCVERFGISPMVCYALCELLVGVGSVTAPFLLRTIGQSLLAGAEMGSAVFLALSSLAILCSILPWATAMGASFPLVMGFLREKSIGDKDTFSFLYLANVVGAALGALCSAYILIELNGFHGTLLIGAQLNVFVAALSIYCLWLSGKTSQSSAVKDERSQKNSAASSLQIFSFLFLSGFVSMGLELIWNRIFAGRLGGNVYAFALILSVYLIATAVGTLVYRWVLVKFEGFDLFRYYPWLAPLSLVGILFADPSPAWLGFSFLCTIVPISFLLGVLTPAAMDQYSAGDEKKAGFAYAVNIAGCILGPLLASYVCLPLLGELPSVLFFFLPVLCGMFFLFRRYFGTVMVSCGVVICILAGKQFVPPYTTAFFGPVQGARNDHTASVSVYGTGMVKSLMVNHVSMTVLTPITKMMVHFPLALLEHKPDSVLVICFGMGTSYRSALSWGAHTQVVELVPSVPKFLPFFHEDAAEIQRNPLGRIVIDDGRRFLKRVREKFDLVTLDPPPPIDAAASGMLYSVEFYEQARQRLKPGGMMQQWWYTTEDIWLFEAALRSIVQVFPHVMIFPSVEGWGFHILASNDPINVPEAKVALSRMPAGAVRDMMEWNRDVAPESQLAKMLEKGKRPWEIKGFGPGPVITDDLPLNEYYFVRKGL